MKLLQISLLYVDGTEQALTAGNREQIRWETRRAREKWPAQTDAPNLYATFMAWQALTYAGETPGTFEDFADRVEALSVEAVEADPTKRATPDGN